MANRFFHRQNAFNFGELSPRLQGRDELEQYKRGVKTLLNALVLPQGGATQRPGLRHVYEAYSHSCASELIPFEFSEEQSYVLEFSDEKMRVLLDGGIVVTPDSDTVLLLHYDGNTGSIDITDDSPSGHTITAEGNANITKLYYYWPNSSLDIDGDGDYIWAADHANFNFGTAGLTIESAVMFNSISGIHTIYYQDDATAGDFVWFYIDHELETINFRVVDAGVELIFLTGTFSPIVDNWYHLAVFRGWGGNANDWAITVDGTSVTTSTDSITMPDHDGQIEIGGISTPLIIDYSSSAHPITQVGNASISSTESKWGDASIYFDGSGDYITVPDSASWDICSEADWTIDVWGKMSTHAGSDGICTQYEDQNNQWKLIHQDGTGLIWQQIQGGTAIINAKGGGEVTDSNWHHFCAMGQSDYYSCYLDGYQVNLTYDTSTDTLAGTLRIGHGWSVAAAAYPWHGYLDEFRLSHVNECSSRVSTRLTDRTAPLSVPARGGCRGVWDFADKPSGWAGGGSWILDGSTSCVQFTDHTDWDICATDRDVQISMWVKHTDHAGTECYMSHNEDGDNKWLLYHTHSTGLKFFLESSNVIVIDLATDNPEYEITDTDWHHVMLIREGYYQFYSIWIDGELSGFTYDSSTDTLAGTLNLGRAYDSVGSWAYYFDGNIVDVSLSEDMFLMARASDMVLDQSPNLQDYSSHGILQNNSYPLPTTTYYPSITGATGSLYFDGTNDFVYCDDDNAFNVADSGATITVSFWAKFSDHVGTEGLFYQWEDANNGWQMMHVHGSGTRFLAYSSGVIIDTTYGTGSEITDTDWHHFAFVTIGDEYAIYIDGTQTNYVQDASSDTYSGVFGIGKRISHPGGTNSYFNGYIADFVLYEGNYFSASPVVGLTDTITVPTALLDFYDSDLVTNGTFTTDSDWTKGDGWSISGGYGECDGTQTAESFLAQSITELGTPGNEAYYFVVEWEVVEISAGSVHIEIGDGVTTALGHTRQRAGKYRELLILDNSNQDELRISANASFVGKVDNISICMYTDEAVSLWLPFQPPTYTPPTDMVGSHDNDFLYFTAAPQYFSVPTGRYTPDANTELLIRGDLYDTDGWYDETRVSTTCRQTANFSLPAQPYPAGGGGTIYEVASPYPCVDVPNLRSLQSSDTLYLFHPDYAVRTLTRTDHDNWTFTEIDWDMPPWNDMNDTAITLDPSAETGTGIDVVASAAFFSPLHVGAYFYQADGYYKITSVTNSINAVADVKSNLTDHLATADWYQGVWDGTQGYPIAGAFHEDRLILVGDESHPLHVFMSETGNYTNFGEMSDPVVDTDPVIQEIWSEQQNQLKWVRSGERLYLGSVGAEFWMTGTDIWQAISPTSILVRKETTHGSRGITPISIGRSIIFVQKDGKVLRDWEYSDDADGYKAEDLSILSEHITKTTEIKKIQYAQSPHSIVWFIDSAYNLFGATYMKQHEFIGFHRHTSSDSTGDADFESIAVIPNYTEGHDELWCSVKRTIDGSTYRTIELLDPQFFGSTLALAFFVDAGLSYAGAATDTFSGLDHLEGEDVQVLADGEYVGTHTVSSGSITLAATASNVHAGLGYNCDIELLMPELATQGGTLAMELKKIDDVMYELYETSSFKHGDTSSNLFTVTQLTSGSMHTGRFKEEFDGNPALLPTILIRQDQPTPFTLLSVALAFSVEDD